MQIQHVALGPCLVVRLWCFAQAGLTLHKWVDFKLNASAHAVGGLYAGWVDFTSVPGM